MKKLSFLIYFLILTPFVYSQNYQTIYPDKEAFYLSRNWDPGNWANPLTFYSAIKIDSSKTNGSDVIHYHHKITRFNGNCVSISDNWTGPKTLIKPSGENIYFTSAIDSILLKPLAKVNESWILFKLINGNFFEASVISKIEQPTLGQLDSVKTISIQCKNSSGTSIAHPFNGKQFVLSKSFGFIKTYDLSNFPNDTSSFTLAGISDPLLGIQNITAKDIYNFNVGDELHLDHFTNNASIYKEQIIYLTKTVSSNQDTLTYSYKSLRVSTKSKTENILTEKIILSENKNLNALPFAIPEQRENELVVNFRTMTAFNQRVSKKDVHTGWIPSNTCLAPLLSGKEDIVYEYMEGLGQFYEGYNLEMGHYIYKRLLYYKKGSETWGNAVDFDALAPIQNKKSQPITHTTSPNPFSDKTVITIQNEKHQTYTLIVTDASGKMVKEYTFSGNELVIQNDGAFRGMYFYKIYTDKNEVSAGKLIVY